MAVVDIPMSAVCWCHTAGEAADAAAEIVVGCSKFALAHLLLPLWFMHAMKKWQDDSEYLSTPCGKWHIWWLQQQPARSGRAEE